MAQKNTLEIIVKAVTDQAQQEFKKLDASISAAAGGVKKSLLSFDAAAQNVGGRFEGIKEAARGLSSNFESLTGVSLSTASIFAGFGIALNKVKDFMVDSINTTAEYGRTVLEMSQKIGASAEETSRLIQVADDFKISVGEMEGAMRIALRNGFQPSIENLAQLSDRIKAINDPTQRAAELTKIFGRNWESLLPMLLAGGDAIRTNAAAISDSLIMTEENVQATEDYRLALDALNDTVEGVKLQIGRQLVPVLADVLGGLTDGATRAEQFQKVWETVKETFRDTGAVTQSFAREMDALRTAMEGGFFFNVEGLADIADKINAIEDPLKRVAEAERIFGKHWVDIFPIIEKGGDYIRGLGNYSERTARELQLFGQSTEDTIQPLADLAKEAEETQFSIETFAKSLSKSDIGWSTQIDMIQEFAAELGIADNAALTFSTDMDFISQALEKGAIGWEEYKDILIDAQDGTINLTNAQRDAIEAQMASIDAQQKAQAEAEKSKDATKEQANALKEYIEQQKEANQAAIDAAQAFSDMAVSLKGAKMAEVAAQSLDILKQALDDGKISEEQFISMSQEIGLSFGLMDQKSIALTENLRRFEEVLKQIPESRADEFLKALYQDAQDGVSSFDLIAAKFGIIIEKVEEMPTPFEIAGESFSNLARQANEYGAQAEAAALASDNSSIAIEGMGLAAARRYTDMQNLSGSISDVTRDAGGAYSPVNKLRLEIDKLKSKTITVTVRTNAQALFGSIVPTFPNRGNRQHGGPVAPNQSYIVGEAGPELFVPNRAGTIIPNSQTPMPFTPGAKTTGGATTTSNITISNSFPIQRANDQWDMRDLARLVAAEIARNPQLR